MDIILSMARYGALLITDGATIIRHSGVITTGAIIATSAAVTGAVATGVAAFIPAEQLL